MPTFGKPVKGSAALKDSDRTKAKGKGKDPLQLEMEQLKEAEIRKKRENLLKSRLMELQKEEVRMATWSSREIQMRWVELLRSEKLEELRAEIEVLAQTHDKTLDRKNAVIEMLSTDLDEEEEQYRLALRTHLQNVDALIELQNQRTAALEEEFEQDLKGLRGEFEVEKVYIQHRHSQEKEDLQLIMNAMKAEAEELESEMQTEFSQQKDETRDKNSEEYNVLKQTLEQEILELQHTISHEHDKYMTTAEEKMKQYQDFTKKDAETAEKISNQMRKIQRLQESIANWKANLANTIKECEERNKAMKEEKEGTAKHFKELKLKMQRWRKTQEDKLNQLVCTAKETKKTLEEKSKKAERMLRLSEQCRSLETERERVLNFQNDQGVDEVQQSVMQRKDRQAMALTMLQQDGVSEQQVMQTFAKQTNADLAMLRQDGLVEEWELLENFWKKYNKVLLDNAAINQEKFHLQNENAKLRALLKQYLDGISVNSDVMSNKHNNLLMTTTFTAGATASAREKTMGSEGGHTVIEANVVVSNARRQRVG
eukprot:NODE_91_length_1985_cov_255.529959_g68_i0.p1 GENE.NODE_91_length_1985_cov_255.529959_g68_i0~~NODE_91_length_1985_cov_255.529959_g68_i0.p1  ORF type:complete len:541 (-),score=269.70 NODE_91_length_1985_cov_255.529959_g68_i0:240-1862(-)